MVKACSEPLGFNNLVSDSVADQLAHRVQLKFTHNVSAVGLGRFHADAQGRGDFLTALTLSQQLNDLALARGEAVTNGFGEIGAYSAIIKITKDHLSGARRKKRLVVGESL